MATAVDLHEHAFLGIAFPTQAVTPSPPLLPGTGDAFLGQNPSDRGSGHDQLLALGQQLGEVLLIHTGVLTSRQRHDPAPLAFFDPLRGSPSAIPVR
jgi:hypothetical protein